MCLIPFSFLFYFLISIIHYISIVHSHLVGKMTIRHSLVMLFGFRCLTLCYRTQNHQTTLNHLFHPFHGNKHFNMANKGNKRNETNFSIKWSNQSIDHIHNLTLFFGELFSLCKVCNWKSSTRFDIIDAHREKLSAAGEKSIFYSHTTRK